MSSTEYYYMNCNDNMKCENLDQKYNSMSYIYMIFCVSQSLFSRTNSNISGAHAEESNIWMSENMIAAVKYLRK